MTKFIVVTVKLADKSNVIVTDQGMRDLVNDIVDAIVDINDDAIKTVTAVIHEVEDNG